MESRNIATIAGRLAHTSRVAALLIAGVLVVMMTIALLGSISCTGSQCSSEMAVLPKSFANLTISLPPSSSWKRQVSTQGARRVEELLMPTQVGISSWPANDSNDRADQRDFALPLCPDILFAHGLMDASCPSSYNRLTLNDPRALIFFISWSRLCTNASALEGIIYAHEPQTTWTVGRNRLYAHILREEARRKCQFLYHFFIDGDSVLTHFLPSQNRYQLVNESIVSSSNVVEIHNWLLEELPFVAAVPFIEFKRPPMILGRFVTEWSAHHDGIYDMFSPRARQYLLPYDETFENTSWYHSQQILVVTAFYMFPKTMLYNSLIGVINLRHLRPHDPVVADAVHTTYKSFRDTIKLLLDAREAAARSILKRFGRICEKNNYFVFSRLYHYWQIATGHMVSSSMPRGVYKEPVQNGYIVHDNKSSYFPFALQEFTKCV